MTLKIACLRGRLDRREGFICKGTRAEFTNSYFYSAALNTSESLYLQHLFYVFVRPGIRDSEPVRKVLVRSSTEKGQAVLPQTFGETGSLHIIP